uniref:Uncharacterized protein n=1 Tax=Anopheles quadriannulatus TaxID=34691 RepID=A0A182XQS5_ANOQN
MMVLLLLLLLQ